MTKVNQGLDDPGFKAPDNIESAIICRKSGKLPTPGVCEYTLLRALFLQKIVTSM